MDWKRLIIRLIGAAVLLGGAIWAFVAMQTPTPAVNETTAGDVAADRGISAVDSNDILAQGIVVPLAETTLSFQVGGQVDDILVAEGQLVQAGDALIRLDGRLQEIGVREAEVDVLEARANLITAEAQLAMARAALTNANVAITAAEVDVTGLTTPPTSSELALQEAIVGVAAANVQDAAGSQSLVLAGSSAAEIGVAEADLAAAEARLFSVRIANEHIAQNESRSDEERRQAQLRLNAAVAEVTAAQARLDDLRAGASGAAQLAAAGSVTAANQQLTAAQAGLDLLLVGPRPESVAVAQANLELARRAAVEAAIVVEQAEIAVEEANAGVRRAEVAHEQALALQDKTVLRAPFSGTVVDITTRVHEIAQLGVPVIALADLSGWRIATIDLSELDVAAVQLDAPATVTLDAFPGQPLRGRVVDLASRAEEIDGNITFVVTISLDDVTLPLRWGMPAFVNVQVAGE